MKVIGVDALFLVSELHTVWQVCVVLAPDVTVDGPQRWYVGLFLETEGYLMNCVLVRDTQVGYS